MSKKRSTPLNDISVNPVYLSARSAIVKPEELVPVTLYSLKKWLPRLGSERWTLVQLLRGLCLDAPRRRDGTKRVVTSWRYLSDCLQVHEETVASWLKHEVIPEDKPWRRIVHNDDYAEYLAIFIPRLRYAYETRNGKTRRVGFTLEVLMEDPIAPEDEIRLAHQMEILSLQQGELNLNFGQRGAQQAESGQQVNPAQAYSPQNSAAVNRNQADSPPSGQPKPSRFTPQQVNPENLGSPSSVKQHNLVSGQGVVPQNVDLPLSKSDTVTLNVNRTKLLINQLKQLKDQKRNYAQILEPLIQLTENILEDYHSTAMYYKVLRVLFPDYTDVYVSAVEQALIAASLNPQVNKGAIFVNTLRQLADELNIDLGFRKPQKNQRSFMDQNEQNQVQPDQGAADSAELNPPALQNSQFAAPIEEVIWSEVLTTLQGQMPRSTFNSVMQETRLLRVERDVYQVQVASPLAKQWLDHRLKGIVEQALASVIGMEAEVAFQLSSQ